ncbi:hypothetical protein MKX03_023033, partial [Papaver bracteatum]
VVGFLKIVTNIQVLQRSGGQSRRMRGTTMKISLWCSAANQVGNDPIDCDSIPRHVLVAVCSTFVKNYQGIPRDLMPIQGESPYLRPMPPKSTRIQTYPKSLKCEKIAAKKRKLSIHFNPDNRKTISQLLIAKWDPSCQ